MTDFRMPAEGEGWRHYKNDYGSLYEIVGIAHQTGSGNAAVVYRRAADGSLWVRPLDEFLGYTEDHKRRFIFERAALSKGPTP